MVGQWTEISMYPHWININLLCYIIQTKDSIKYGNTRNEDLKHSFLIRFNTILKVLAELPDI